MQQALKAGLVLRLKDCVEEPLFEKDYAQKNMITIFTDKNIRKGVLKIIHF